MPKKEVNDMSNATVRRGSGNVYKDLGFQDAEKMQAKAALVSKILSITQQKKWTQEKIASVLGISQPKVSRLSRGQFSGFSIEKLISLLTKLNQDVEIIIRKSHHTARQHTGHVSVTYA